MVAVAIVVPGIMGSELYKGGKLIWPGTLAELGLPYKKMKELLDPDLRVGDIIRSFSLAPQYSTLVWALGVCGFVEGGEKPTLFGCPYDWRADNAKAAVRLGNCVRKAHEAHGSDLVISIVAHSMGGLVARYFLESGQFDEAKVPGFSAIKRLLTLGTPHRGTPLALLAALGHEKRLFLSASQVREVASDANFPALYQLLPPSGEPFAWDKKDGSRLKAADIYDPKVAARLGLSAPNLASAKTFHESLDFRRRPKAVDYFCFVGTQHSTYSNVRGDFDAEQSDADGLKLKGAGDGTVPTWSAAIPGTQQLPVGGEHGSIYSDEDLLRTMAALLGKPNVLAAADPTKVRLSLSGEVVFPRETIEVVIQRNLASDKFVGELVLSRIADAAGVVLTLIESVSTIGVSYDGAPLDALTVHINAPRFAGTYRLSYLERSQTACERPREFIVQRRVSADGGPTGRSGVTQADVGPGVVAMKRKNPTEPPPPRRRK